jgi:hypothetical protein
MSVFYYDPFHDVERIINDTFGRMGGLDNQSQAFQRQNGSDESSVPSGQGKYPTFPILGKLNPTSNS